MMPLKLFGSAEMTTWTHDPWADKHFGPVVEVFIPTYKPKSYYENEFSKLGNTPATMQIRNEKGQTRWMTLKPEQIKSILEILKDGE
jgi:hypothetical protein